MPIVLSKTFRQGKLLGVVWVIENSNQKNHSLFRIFQVYFIHQLIIFSAIYLGKILYARPGTPKSPSIIIQTLTNWDGQWYLRIATEGYTESSAAFFPLFPSIIRILTNLGMNQIVAGVIISNLALLGLCIVFYRLLRLDYQETTSLNALWYILLFPTSFFLTSSYTEPLFLLLVLLGF